MRVSGGSWGTSSEGEAGFHFDDSNLFELGLDRFPATREFSQRRFV